MTRRKENFERALKRAGMTGKEWRSSYYQVSWQHLNECFAGRRVMGAELKAAIDRFIREQKVR